MLPCSKTSGICLMSRNNGQNYKNKTRCHKSLVPFKKALLPEQYFCPTEQNQCNECKSVFCKMRKKIFPSVIRSDLPLQKKTYCFSQCVLRFVEVLKRSSNKAPGCVLLSLPIVCGEVCCDLTITFLRLYTYTPHSSLYSN